MPMLSSLKITLAFFAISSSALQLNANSDEGRPKDVAAESSMGWVGEQDVHHAHGGLATGTTGMQFTQVENSSLKRQESRAKASDAQKKVSQTSMREEKASAEIDSKADRVAHSDSEHADRKRKKKIHRKITKKENKHGQQKVAPDARKQTKLAKPRKTATLGQSHKKASHATSLVGQAASGASATPKSVASAPLTAKMRAGQAASSGQATPKHVATAALMTKPRGGWATGGVTAAPAKVVSSVSNVATETAHAAPASEDEDDSDILLPVGNTSLLPSMDVFVKKPANVLQSLTSKLDQLKTSLADKASAHRAAVKAQKDKYDANLAALRQNISILGTRNWRIKHEIESLDTENSQLRQKAIDLKNIGHELERQLSEFHENMSNVHEFLTGALEVPEDADAKTHVLRVLQEQDSADQQKLAHHTALAAIHSMSLIQTPGQDETDTLNEKTFSYVARLNNSFGDLDAEQASSELSLQQKYEEEYAIEAERQRDALADHEALKARKAAATELHTRLQAAVAHLDRSVSNFRQRLAGLQRYVGILSRV